MDKNLLYKKAYRVLENATPLKYDCGQLCNKKCCTGDQHAGMHLYPGEALFLGKNQNILKMSSEPFGSGEITFAVCRGTCDRSFRPLSCRIYPFVPYLDRYQILSIIEDPRAKYICPLLFDMEEIKPDKSFNRKIKEVFQLLLRDPEIRDYISTLSKVLEEYSKFTNSGHL